MQLISKNVDLHPPLKTSSWRKIAIGTWRSVGDPSVYATLDVDVGNALNYLEELKAESHQKITLTHFMGKAIAKVLEQHPEINCILRFGKLYPRKNVDVFFQVASDISGKDLSGTTIRDANQKSILEIVSDMQDQVNAIRMKGDPKFKKMKKTMGSMPSLFVPYLIDFVGFFMYSLNLWSPLLGSPRDPFGSVMITNIGSLGLEMAFAPLVPYSRIPLLIALGAVKETPVVKNGKVEIAKICRICTTFDHRLIDGMHGSQMARTLLKIFENPRRELEGNLAQSQN